jgi:hypothetical protein
MTDVSTHLDWSTIKDAASLDANPSAKDAAVSWYTAKYGEAPKDVNSAAFKTWAVGELQAATDSRLTNPYDATAHAIDSSTTLTQDQKDIWKKALSDPKTYGMDFVVKTAADGTRTVEAVSGGTGEATVDNSKVVFVKDESELSAKPYVNHDGANTWESPVLNTAMASNKKVSIGGKLYTVTSKDKNRVLWDTNNSTYTLLGDDGTTKTIKVTKP